MPPKKRFARMLKMNFTQLDLVLLEVLVQTAGGSFGSHTRRALRYYAKMSAISDEAIAMHVREEVCPHIRGREARQDLVDDFESYRRNEVQLPTSSEMCDIAELPPMETFSSATGGLGFERQTGSIMRSAVEVPVMEPFWSIFDDFDHEWEGDNDGET